MLQGLAESLSTTSKTQAKSLLGFGIEVSQAGDKWLEKSAKFQKKAIKTLTELNQEAMQLCMSQPIDD